MLIRLLLGAVLLLTACQQAPAPQARTPDPVSLTAQLRGEGDALMAGGNHAGAVEKYRQALDREPDSVPLRFALGTAYSFLDKRRAAIAQFRWLIANAPGDTVEHQEARRWLVRVGALAESSPVAGSRPEAPPAEAASTETESTPKGAISGKTQWSGLDLERGPVGMKIVLTGDEDSTRAVSRKESIALGDPYEFKDVPEGSYRVRGIFGEETVIWDRKITVQAGKTLELPLTQAASRTPIDVLPRELK